MSSSETDDNEIDACIRSGEVCPVTQIFLKHINHKRIVVLEGTCFYEYAFIIDPTGENKYYKETNPVTRKEWRDKKSVARTIDKIVVDNYKDRRLEKEFVSVLIDVCTKCDKPPPCEIVCPITRINLGDLCLTQPERIVMLEGKPYSAYAFLDLSLNELIKKIDPETNAEWKHKELISEIVDDVYNDNYDGPRYNVGKDEDGNDILVGFLELEHLHAHHKLPEPRMPNLPPPTPFRSSLSRSTRSRSPSSRSRSTRSRSPSSRLRSTRSRSPPSFLLPPRPPTGHSGGESRNETYQSDPGNNGISYLALIKQIDPNEYSISEYEVKNYDTPTLTKTVTVDEDGKLRYIQRLNMKKINEGGKPKRMRSRSRRTARRKSRRTARRKVSR